MCKRISYILFFLLISIPLVGQSSGVILKASGATFPYPLYKDWMKAYHAATGVRISYEAIGSGNGIKELVSRKVDFCGSDAFLSDKEMDGMEQEILHIPSCLGAVVVSYNLPDHRKLKLTQTLLAGIFSGEIRHWRDRRIADVNPGIKLPDLNINVVHRSDGSGTTFIFTHYLSAVSRKWQQEVGSGKQVSWPTGMGADRNSGVVDCIKRIPGSIGYMELTYATEAKLPMAMIQNQSGRFIEPTLDAVSAAAEVELPDDTRSLIVNTPAAEGYPICGFTWLLFYKEQSYQNRSLQRAKTLANFLCWAIHEGQAFNKKAIYGTLPKEAVQKAESILESMTYKGVPLINR